MSCYGCKCNFCARSCELYASYVTIGEVDDCCFNCDECREFDGDYRKRWKHRSECERFIEARKYAEAKAAAMRRSLRVIKGGKSYGKVDKM